MNIFEKQHCGCGKCCCCGWREKNYWVEPGIEEPELQNLLLEVSKESGVTVEQIKGCSRREKVCVARQMYCYAARLQNKWKDWQIGAAIKKDRTSVIHSCGVVKTMLETGRPPEYVALANRLGIIPSQP